jgi:hypothetical protein
MKEPFTASLGVRLGDELIDQRTTAPALRPGPARHGDIQVIARALSGTLSDGPVAYALAVANQHQQAR